MLPYFNDWNYFNKLHHQQVFAQTLRAARSLCQAWLKHP